MSKSEHCDIDVENSINIENDLWKNENLIEFTTRTARSDNLSTNQNLIVGEFIAIESWKMIIIIHARLINVSGTNQEWKV